MTGIRQTKNIPIETHDRREPDERHFDRTSPPRRTFPPRAQSPLPELKPAGRNIRRPAIHDPIKRSNAISGSRTAAAGSRGGANQINHREDREERDSDTIQKAYYRIKKKKN